MSADSRCEAARANRGLRRRLKIRCGPLEPPVLVAPLQHPLWNGGGGAARNLDCPNSLPGSAFLGAQDWIDRMASAASWTVAAITQQPNILSSVAIRATEVVTGNARIVRVELLRVGGAAAKTRPVNIDTPPACSSPEFQRPSFKSVTCNSRRDRVTLHGN